MKRKTGLIILLCLIIGCMAALAACGDNTDTATVPGQPQSFSATAGNAQVTLSWTAPASDGGSTISKYEVKKDSDAWITASGSTTHTFTGLTNGTQYTFKVRAVNAKGNSEEASTTATPTGGSTQTAPTAPQSFSAVAGDAQVVLTWTAPASDGGSAITGYQLTKDNWATKTDVAANVLTYTFLGLINDTAYTFKVRAANAIGNGSAAEATATPLVVQALQTVSAGGAHSLAIDSSGNLWSWGSNTFGQLGNGNNTYSNVPVKIKDDTTFVAVSAGYYHSMAIDSSGNLWTWGQGTYGKLGNSSTGNRNTPIKIQEDTTFAAISAGGDHSMAIDSEGNLWTFGQNGYGQLGNGSTTGTASIYPIKIKDGTKFVSISAGHYHSMAIDSSGNLWTWGSNYYGELGNGTTTNSSTSTPIQIKDGTKFVSISAGGTGNNPSRAFSMAIDKSGNLWAWGNNERGRLGDGTTTNSSIPIQIKDGTKFVTVGANGTGHCIAVDKSGNLWTWGNNWKGQLGNGTETNSFIPIQIKDGTKFVVVSAGDEYCLALDKDGNLWAWGSGASGKLGNGDIADSNIPIIIKEGTKFKVN